MIIECKKSKDKPWVFFSASMHQSKDVSSFTKYVRDFDLYFNHGSDLQKFEYVSL